MTINNSSNVCCPKCESWHIHRVPRPLLVKRLLSFIPLRRYQCLSCLTTFAAPKIKREVASLLVVAPVNVPAPAVKQPVTL